jgi:quercetin dioxygenase-like cupin family protein
MAKIIKTRGLEQDEVYEPPLSIGWGLNNKTVENTRMAMGLAITPPGGRNQRHYHINTDAGMYILKGRLRFFIGPDKKEVEAEAGDFVFVPRGEIHGQYNPSDTEPAEVIACYGAVGHKDEAGTIYVEDRWDQEPQKKVD